MMRGTLVDLARMATRAAWAQVRALEKPGGGIPSGREIRDACANARLVASICDALHPDELEHELEDFELLPDGAFIPPPGD